MGGGCRGQCLLSNRVIPQQFLRCLYMNSCYMNLCYMMSPCIIRLGRGILLYYSDLFYNVSSCVRACFNNITNVSLPRIYACVCVCVLICNRVFFLMYVLCVFISLFLSIILRYFFLFVFICFNFH